MAEVIKKRSALVDVLGVFGGEVVNTFSGKTMLKVNAKRNIDSKKMRCDRCNKHVDHLIITKIGFICMVCSCMIEDKDRKVNIKLLSIFNKKKGTGHVC